MGTHSHAVLPHPDAAPVFSVVPREVETHTNTVLPPPWTAGQQDD